MNERDLLEKLTGLGAERLARALMALAVCSQEAREQVARLFTLERYCFRGSIDDWIPLAYGQPLDSLADKFFPHLGKESFYELI